MGTNQGTLFYHSRLMLKMNVWWLSALATCCGFLLTFAFSPFDAVWLAVFALAIWLYLCLTYPAYVLQLGFAFALGWFGFGGWWLADTLHIYGHIPYVLALLTVALLAVVMGFFMAAWVWLTLKLKQQQHDILWLFPSVGVLEEWLRSFIFTGFPWTALGNLIVTTPAAPWVSVLGSYFAVWLLLVVVSAVVLLLKRETRQQGIWGLVVAMLLFALTPTLELEKTPMKTVALVQPNIAQNEKWDAAYVQETMSRLLKLSQQERDVHLIIWPEAAVPIYLSQAPAWDNFLASEMATWQADVAFGGIKLLKKDENGLRKSQNGLFLAQKHMPDRQFVGKHHLVPFGEYVPAWLPWLGKIVPDIGNFVPATDDGILHAAEHKLGVLICYESIFSDEAAARITHGAEVLIVVSNDAWYDQSPAAWQHLQAAQMRALETGRYVLRAANTGVTAIITPDGKIQSQIPWWQEGVLRGTYQTLTHLTPYQQWGNMPILSFIFIVLAFAGWRMRGFYQGRIG